MAKSCRGARIDSFFVPVAVENLRGASQITHNGGAIFLLICHNLGCFSHCKRNMNCSSANAPAASHADTLAVPPPRSGLLLPFLVVMFVFAVTTISVHLPVLVPIEATFIDLHLPHEDLDGANSTVDDEIEDSLPPFSSPSSSSCASSPCR